MDNNSINKKVGESYINKYGSEYTIIKYNNATNITVKFDNGYIKENVSYSNIKRGKITSPYCKTICNIGYIGEGDAPITINNKISNPYYIWNNMINRCYDKNFQEKHPSYKGCTICNEWLNYNTFYNWYKNNYYNIENEVMMLDKDIIYKGNKIYSPNKCVFVPQYINSLFTKSNNKRGKYPIGVNLNCNKYMSQICKNNKKETLGLFNTPEEAFHVYKIEKENFIKHEADRYKNKIPQKLYDAMYRYKIEITD